ncbi:MAG: phosphopantetheine-binding protein [Granulosicoccus sp.]
MTLPDTNSIAHHITHELLNDPDVSIAADEDLLLSGLLDSISVMRLVAWLEAQCGISIGAGDIVLEHFGSLNQMRAYLETRSG